MSDDFYTKYLGIPAGPRPPKAHVLLGIAADVRDAVAIEAAANRRMDQLDQYALSSDQQVTEQVQQIMNEVAKARVALIKQASKSEKPAAKPKRKKAARPAPAEAERIREPRVRKSKAKAGSESKRRATRDTKTKSSRTRTKKRRKQSRRSLSNLSPEGWAIFAVCSVTALMLGAMLVYMIVSSVAEPPALANETSDTFDPADETPPDEPPPIPREPEDPSPDENENENTEEPAPPQGVPTWEQVAQITDPDARLAAFIVLRDSMVTGSPEQVELLQDALDLFNRIEGSTIDTRTRDGVTFLMGTTNSRIDFRANADITDLSPFTGMRLSSFQLYGLEMVEDFDVLATMQIEDLRLLGCDGLTRLNAISRVDGLKTLWLGNNRMRRLLGIGLQDLEELHLVDCGQLETLDGLQSASIEKLWLVNCPELRDISAFRKTSGVRELYLANLPITNLQAIFALPLESLQISSCESLESLAGLENISGLKDIILTGPTRLVPTEVIRIAKIHPNANIRNDLIYPKPPLPAPLHVASLEEVMQIEDERVRLASFIALRDRLNNDLDAQTDLLREALKAFNNTDEVNLNSNVGFGNKRTVSLAPDRSGKNANADLTNLSVFSGMTLHRLSIEDCKRIKSFDFLKTMQIESLSIKSCFGFTDIDVLNHIEGLKTLSLWKLNVTDLRPLKLKEFSALGLTECHRLRSLAGLEGMKVGNFAVKNNDAMEDFSALESMEIYSALRLTDTAFDDMSLLKGKTFTLLDVSGCKRLKTLRGVETMARLDTLGAANTSVPYDEVQRAQRLMKAGQLSKAFGDEPKPEAIDVKSFAEVKQIKDPEVRLASYLKLRDSYKPYSDEQKKLVGDMLLLTNGMDSFNSMRFTRSTGTGKGFFTLRASMIPEHESPNRAFHDLSALTGLDIPSVWLDYLPNIKDFTPLTTMKIERLRIEGCTGFSDVSLLNDIDGLQHVMIGQTSVRDLSTLKIEQPLEYLSIHRLRGLTSLKGLEGLKIGNINAKDCANLRDIESLAEVKGLTQLDLSGTAITDLTPLRGLKLTRLMIGDCDQLRSLEGLEEMYSLETLSVRGSRHISQADADKALAMIRKKEAEGPEEIAYKTDDPKLQAIFKIKDSADRLDAFIKYRDSLSRNQAAQGRVIGEAIKAFNGIEHVDLRHTKGGRDQSIWLHAVEPRGDNLQGLQITNLSPFKGMKLHVLQMGRLANAHDFSVLKTIDVQKLFINGCTQFSDLSLIAHMNRLDELNLSGTAVADLTPLRGMKLKRLRIENCNQLRSLEGLEGMDTLETILVKGSQHISENDVKRFFEAQKGVADGPDQPEPVGGLNDVMKIKDKDARLAAFIKLRDGENTFSEKQIELIRGGLLAFNGIKKVNAEFSFDNARKCDLDIDEVAGNKLVDISPLSGLTFDILKLQGNASIRDFEPLRTTTMRWLMLNGCAGFTDITVLNDIKNLKIAHLNGTGVTSLKGLKTRSLQYLVFGQSDKLTTLDGLQGMTLRSVVCKEVPNLEDISALSQVRGVSTLFLTSSKVTELTPVSKLPLQRVDLTNCQKLTSLKGLDSIKSLRTLTLVGCTALPEAEIERFKRENPKVEVVR